MYIKFDKSFDMSFLQPFLPVFFSRSSISFFLSFSLNSCRLSSLVRSRAQVVVLIGTLGVFIAGHTRRSDNGDVDGPGPTGTTETDLSTVTASLGDVSLDETD